MGALLGLTFGLGVFLVVGSFGPPPRRRTPRVSRRDKVVEMLLQAGIESVTPGRLAACCAGVGAVVAGGMYVVSRSPVIAVAFGLLATWAPVAVVRFRARQRRAELRDLWPEVVDNLASAVRAGLALPEALTQVGTRGPVELRPPFLRFGQDYRATGRFYDSLDRLKAALADPVGDRIVESLRMARQVGGSDLGRLLRTLSAFLREDARTRAELETRQGWTINMVTSLPRWHRDTENATLEDGLGSWVKVVPSVGTLRQGLHWTDTPTRGLRFGPGAGRCRPIYFKIDCAGRPATRVSACRSVPNSSPDAWRMILDRTFTGCRVELPAVSAVVRLPWVCRAEHRDAWAWRGRRLNSPGSRNGA